MSSSTPHSRAPLPLKKASLADLPAVAETFAKDEDQAFQDLEMALGLLSRVEVPDELKGNILARVNGEAGYLGFGRRQWWWAGLSFGAWMLLTQGVFSWMLGGMSAL